MAPVADGLPSISGLPGINQHKHVVDADAQLYEPKIDKSASQESINHDAGA